MIDEISLAAYLLLQRMRHIGNDVRKETCQQQHKVLQSHIYISRLRHNANCGTSGRLTIMRHSWFWLLTSGNGTVLVMQNVNITRTTGQLPLRHVTLWAVQEQMDHVTLRITVSTMPMKVGAQWDKLARSNLTDNICNSQSPMAKKTPRKISYIQSLGHKILDGSIFIVVDIRVPLQYNVEYCRSPVCRKLTRSIQ